MEDTIFIDNYVVSIPNNKYENNSELRTIEFAPGSNLKTIGNNAFRNAINLRNIDIPASVQSIGRGAFSGAKALTTINIPARVTHIGKGAFSGADSLTQVIFEEGSPLRTIKESVFEGATSLKIIRIPALVWEISSRAFADTPMLEQIVFEKNSKIVLIRNDAFVGSGLTNVIIEKSALDELNNTRDKFLGLPPLTFGKKLPFFGKDDVIIEEPKIAPLLPVSAFEIDSTPMLQVTTKKNVDNPTSSIFNFFRGPKIVPGPAGGTRKSRTRKRGIRRIGRKASGARRMKKGRRTMKRK
jgi:hypothetical protein